jgi:hypothetical protein
MVSIQAGLLAHLLAVRWTVLLAMLSHTFANHSFEFDSVDTAPVE